ncbi:MAG: putative endonuclease [Candidatus Dependentiae bacterium]|nr:putative endonuclease [Candidatus Dependentiae bacterium]
MFYVYLIRSINFPELTYIGFTLNLNTRVTAHNNGEAIHTSKYKPWKLEMYCAFIDEVKAKAFERYLKSGSGRAFAKKHLW